MEIDQTIYNQYRDTPFKPDEINNNKNNIFWGKKIKNPNMDDYINYVLEKTEEIEPPKETRNSYNIILTASLDKSRRINMKESSMLNSNNEASNLDTTNAQSKNEVYLYLKNQKDYDGDKNEKNLQNKKIEEINYNNNYNMNNLNEEERRVDDNNDMIIDNYNENNVGGLNNKENYIYKNNGNNKVQNSLKYYNPFSESNNYENDNHNHQINTETNSNNKICNKKGKLPNIILTAYHQPKKTTNPKEDILSNFLNLFSHKKQKKQENDDTKLEDMINNKKNKLQTLEVKLQSNEDKIKNNEEKLNNEMNNFDKKVDLILGTIPPKKENVNSNRDIEKLKINLSGNEYEDENKNDNNKCFMVQAEPILNSDNKRSSAYYSEDDNLGNSCQLVDLDKSSEYTLQTGTNIDRLIRKKSKFSPVLMGILLGFCALFYFMYKKIKIKEILSKFSELFNKVPEFCNYVLAFFGQGIDDFMERYGDINRLFVGVVCIISFWFIFKSLMKRLFKRQKK